MLITDLRAIGNNLYKVRKTKGLTQAEVAELAELSDRTYADIERGSVAMRVDSLLKICTALHITPNDVLTNVEELPVTEDELLHMLRGCSSREKDTALRLLNVYVHSL